MSPRLCFLLGSTMLLSVTSCTRNGAVGRYIEASCVAQTTRTSGATSVPETLEMNCHNPANIPTAEATIITVPSTSSPTAPASTALVFPGAQSATASAPASAAANPSPATPTQQVGSANGDTATGGSAILPSGTALPDRALTKYIEVVTAKSITAEEKKALQD